MRFFTVDLNPDPKAWHSGVLERNKSTGELTGKFVPHDDFIETRTIPPLSYNFSPVSFGRYAFHIERWLKHFRPDQLLIVGYDELKQNPEIVQGRIGSFLGHPLPGLLQERNAQKTASEAKGMSCAARARMNEVFLPMNLELYELLNRTAKSFPSMQQHPFPPFSLPLCE